MKKTIFLLIAAFGALSTFAQTPPVKNYATDADLSRWVLDLNFLGGGYIQHMNTNTTANYLNGVNMNTGTPDFKNGMAVGGDAQIGFFFGKNRHWGIGTGIMYLREWGDLTLNNFHAEYQSTDANGNIFRQVVSANQIDERIKIDNFNIPLLLKYKKRVSKHWGFTGDAGLLFNLQMKNEYKTNASFDYEAIYKINNNGDGSVTSVYDNSPTPAGSDFLITKAQYSKNNPEGNVQSYFNTKSSQGYNVGLGVSPNSTTGTVSYASGSVGFLFQPSFNYFFSDMVALNFGGYYLYQPFNNSGSNTYMLTNKPGDYSSVSNSVSHTENYSYGLNVGLRFFLGKKEVPKIISVDALQPSQCGMCDGGLVLHGLRPGKEVIVNYSREGTPQTAYTGNVDASGSVKITSLCEGKYTDIDAKIRKHTSTGNPVTLIPPPITISSENNTNPSANGVCDGTISINGLNTGQTVTVNYMRNGAAQQSFTSVVPAGKTVILTGLCEGSYTGFKVNGNNCTAAAAANGTDVTLTAPAPPPPPPAPAHIEEKIDISTPILFDFNKTTIHVISYPVLKEAADEMKEDKTINVTIDGYTDIVGSDAYNNRLSVRRANAVKAHLTKMGISPRRLKTAGHGKRSPVGDNGTPEGRSQNRRAIMKIAPARN